MSLTDQPGGPFGLGHHVEFYETEAFLVDSVSRFIGPAVQNGDAAIVVATARHRLAFEAALRQSGVDLTAPTAERRYQAFDAADLLATISVDGKPDALRFRETLRPVIEDAAGEGRRVRIYGEMVSILWDGCEVVSAIALERLWNDLRDELDFALLCAYPMGTAVDEASASDIRQVCGVHTSVIPSPVQPILAAERGDLDDMSAFAAAAAHDLKSPLHAVLGFSELVADIYGDRLDDIGREMLADIVSGVHRMEGVIDDLVRRSRPGPTMSRPEVGPARPAPTGPHVHWAVPTVATTLTTAGRAAGRGKGSATDASAAPRPLNVLVVEDSAEHTRLIGSLLAWAPAPGYPMRRVGTVAQALAVLNTTEVDCVLLDLTLPDATDLEAVAQVRAAAPHLPIVVITSSSDETLSFAAVREGAQDYLVKGHIDVEQLSRSIRWAVQRKKLETELARHALHDALTGLPNRTLMLDRLRSALARTERQGTRVAVFYLDLDGFKPVNDHLGHEGGDRVLTTVAGRLRTVVRPQDTVARIGGDEFVVICEGFQAQDAEWESLRTRIAATVATPIEIEGHTVKVTASIGVSVGGCEVDTECLLREADRAMYRSKRSRV